MRQPSLLPARRGLRLGSPASPRLRISGCGRVGPGAGHECQSARGPPPAPTTVSSGATPVLRAGSQSALPDRWRGEEWGRETAGWLAGCGGRGARAPTLPCPAPFLRVRLVGPRRRRAEPAWGGPGRAGAGAGAGPGRAGPGPGPECPCSSPRCWPCCWLPSAPSS